MIIIKEADLPKLEDIGFIPKYNEDNGVVDRYVLQEDTIEVYSTDNYFGVHQNPYIWKLKVSNYAYDMNMLDTLFDVLTSGLFHRVDSLKELKSIINENTEDNTEEPVNNQGEPDTPNPEEPNTPSGEPDVSTTPEDNGDTTL